MGDRIFAERPPSANRGVETGGPLGRKSLVDGRLCGVSVDYLTFTTPEASAAVLIDASEVIRPGGKVQGFGRSELRRMMGGEGWRRWEPCSGSKRWGKAYESWEWAGAASHWPAERLRTIEGYPSRVDLAFDFECGSDERSDDVVRRVRAWVKQKGLKLGVSGEGGINTRYIGSIASPRRVRIYRKDLRDAGWALQFGPTLRVELILKDERATDFWAVWCDSPEGAVRGAAHHIEQMMGRSVLDDAQPIPRGKVLEPAWEYAEKLARMMKQYGAVADAAFEVGIDLVGLCAEFQRGRGRTVQWRRSELGASIERAGVEQVESCVRMLLDLDE